MSINKIYSDGDYLRKNPTWDSGDSPWKARHIYEILKKNKISIETVNEIGCGAGEVLLELVGRIPGSTGRGYEISPQAFEICSKKNNESCSFYLINSEGYIERSDLLLCIDVIEHIEDYFSFLRKIRGFAKYMVFHIPLEMNLLSVMRDEMLRSRDLVGHLHYFSKKTALKTLEDCGYEVISFSYTPSFMELPRYSLKSISAFIPRFFLFLINKNICIKFFGGASLLVLAKAS